MRYWSRRCTRPRPPWPASRGVGETWCATGRRKDHDLRSGCRAPVDRFGRAGAVPRHAQTRRDIGSALIAGRGRASVSAATVPAWRGRPGQGRRVRWQALVVTLGGFEDFPSAWRDLANYDGNASRRARTGPVARSGLTGLGGSPYPANEVFSILHCALGIVARHDDAPTCCVNGCLVDGGL